MIPVWSPPLRCSGSTSSRLEFQFPLHSNRAVFLRKRHPVSSAIRLTWDCMGITENRSMDRLQRSSCTSRRMPIRSCTENGRWMRMKISSPEESDVTANGSIATTTGNSTSPRVTMTVPPRIGNIDPFHPDAGNPTPLSPPERGGFLFLTGEEPTIPSPVSSPQNGYVPPPWSGRATPPGTPPGHVPGFSSRPGNPPS